MKPVWSDYRAPCRPFATGCRQCGTDISARRAYCSVECSEEFQQHHFWNTARWEAVRRACPETTDAAVLRLVYAERALCARCGAKAWQRSGPEVNHKVPLNGDRPAFGCCHHQENLEVVCHDCHVTIGIEQRAAGLIGTPKRLNGAMVRACKPVIGPHQDVLPLEVA
jgi:hypothetical protein